MNEEQFNEFTNLFIKALLENKIVMIKNPDNHNTVYTATNFKLKRFEATVKFEIVDLTEFFNSIKKKLFNVEMVLTEVVAGTNINWTVKHTKSGKEHFYSCSCPLHGDKQNPCHHILAVMVWENEGIIRNKLNLIKADIQNDCIVTDDSLVIPRRIENNLDSTSNYIIFMEIIKAGYSLGNIIDMYGITIKGSKTEFMEKLFKYNKYVLPVRH